MKRIGLLAVALLICGLLLAVLLVGCGRGPAPIAGAASSGLRDIKVSATTDGSGDSTDTFETSVSGRLYAIEWVDGDCANGVDITVTITSGPSGVDQQVFRRDNVNDDAIYYPRIAIHDIGGTAVTFDGSNEIYELPVVAGVPQIVVSAGGATKTCESLLYYYP